MLDWKISSERNADLLADAIKGLSARRKTLSPKWFYDQRGSELFEEITTLEEYYPTRTEAMILTEHAAQLAGLVPEGGALVGLGSGASVKTRRLLDAGPHFGGYVPIDISEDFLLSTAKNLQTRYPDIAIYPIVGDFIRQLTLPNTISDLPKVGFFPGSTIGNLEPTDAVSLLERARQREGMERFILGADLIKDRTELVAAYDDRSGVTAAFNLNLLTRLNREAHADFNLPAFRHEARWMGDRIEMHLVARHRQVVTISDTSIVFEAGESIHTESCRKYTYDSLSSLAAKAGWSVEMFLTDAHDKYAVAVLLA